MNRQEHWNHVYTTKSVTEVSWYEREPEPSLTLIRRWLKVPSRIIDIGGGASVLVDRLVSAGYQMTVLDISAKALEHSQQRLGAQAFQVTWIEADITAIDPPGEFDLWHDRAVFHFLTDPTERQAYISLAEQTVRPGGLLILGVFADDGPTRCSGLEVCRYSEESLAAEFSRSFRIVEVHPHHHLTPAQKDQSFIYAVFQRNSC
jgi:SAM-dependent methyltransferase